MSPTAEQLAHAAAWLRENGIGGSALTATEHECERLQGGVHLDVPAEMAEAIQPELPLAARIHEPCSAWEPKLIEILRARRGPEAAITSHELAAALGTTNRNARACVQHLRSEHGLPICSTTSRDNPGYFYPRRLEDALPTLNQLASRQREIGAAVDGMRDGLQREFGSLDLFGRNAA